MGIQVPNKESKLGCHFWKVVRVFVHALKYISLFGKSCQMPIVSRKKFEKVVSLSLVCFQLLIEGTMGMNCRHEQSICPLDKRVLCPQAAQCVGSSGKKHCLYSPVRAWLVIQCMMCTMVVMESLDARMKKFALGLLHMLSLKCLCLCLMASHCHPLYSCAVACTFHQESISSVLYTAPQVLVDSR